MLNKYNSLTLPQELQKHYIEIEEDFKNLLQKGNFNKMASEWKRLYSEFLDFQTKVNSRLHKGGVLHNLGIAYFYAKNLQDSFNNFTLAFSEDVVTQEEKFGGSAEEGPAAKNLISLFGVKKEMFEEVRKVVKAHLEDNLYWDPKKLFAKRLKTYFKEATDKRKVDELKSKTAIIKQSINKIQGIWKKRVFIGGSYQDLTNIYTIRRAIEKKKYIPIIAFDFKDKEPPTHDYALLLLHNCKFAIFDISKDSGHLMEVERTLDYRTKTLFVYENTPNPSMTEMIKSMGKKRHPFSTQDSLEDLVYDFLS